MASVVTSIMETAFMGSGPFDIGAGHAGARRAKRGPGIHEDGAARPHFRGWPNIAAARQRLAAWRLPPPRKRRFAAFGTGFAEPQATAAQAQPGRLNR
jgi:hypothetical protein